MENQTHEKNDNNDKPVDDFDSIKELYELKRANIYEIEKNLKLLKGELKEIRHKMQSVCKHEFVREVVTSGPYREIAYICKKCNYWN